MTVGEVGKRPVIVTVGDADSSLRSNWGGVIPDNSSAATEFWSSEASLRLGILGSEPFMEFRCRGESESRMDLGGGDGLSCARIMRLAMAEDGSERVIRIKL